MIIQLRFESLFQALVLRDGGGSGSGHTGDVTMTSVAPSPQQHPGWPQCAGGHITRHISMCHKSHWRVSRLDRRGHVMSCQVQICLMTRGGTVDLCYELCTYSFNETRHKAEHSVMKVNSWPSLVWCVIILHSSYPQILQLCRVQFSDHLFNSAVKEPMSQIWANCQLSVLCLCVSTCCECRWGRISVMLQTVD